MNKEDAQKLVDDLVEHLKSHCIDLHVRICGEYGGIDEIKLTNMDKILAMPQE